MFVAHQSFATASRRAFTLIELLITVAIIGLLASILLVSLAEARNKAWNTAQVQQLRELQRAFSFYADDNNGTFPLDPLNLSSCLGSLEGDGACFGGNQVSAVVKTKLEQYISLPVNYDFMFTCINPDTEAGVCRRYTFIWNTRPVSSTANRCAPGVQNSHPSVPGSSPNVCAITYP